MRRILPFVFGALVLTGCASRIEGETTKLPPSGGPGASSRHPPGESASIIQHDEGKPTSK